jgi:hypothetical protein
MVSASYDSESDLETSIRKFSLSVAYVSFFVKLIVALVYWKDSLDFDNIVAG